MQTFILRSDEIRQRALRYLSHLDLDPDHPLQVTIEPHEERRTVEQNNLWQKISRSLSEQVVIEGRRFSHEAWKEKMKRDVLGTEMIMLPDGAVIEVARKSSQAKKDVFSALIDHGLEICAEYRVVIGEI